MLISVDGSTSSSLHAIIISRLPPPKASSTDGSRSGSPRHCAFQEQRFQQRFRIFTLPCLGDCLFQGPLTQAKRIFKRWFQRPFLQGTAVFKSHVFKISDFRPPHLRGWGFQASRYRWHKPRSSSTDGRSAGHTLFVMWPCPDKRRACLTSVGKSTHQQSARCFIELRISGETSSQYRLNPASCASRMVS